MKAYEPVAWVGDAMDGMDNLRMLKALSEAPRLPHPLLLHAIVALTVVLMLV